MRTITLYLSVGCYHLELTFRDLSCCEPADAKDEIFFLHSIEPIRHGGMEYRALYFPSTSDPLHGVLGISGLNLISRAAGIRLPVGVHLSKTYLDRLSAP